MRPLLTWFAAKIHYNIGDDDGCGLFMFVGCIIMERCRVGSGRIAGAFVLVCA